jgi:hypothetical protein
MKLVMTLLVRDEADVLRLNLEHHLAQGVDFFLITDNGSRDATASIAAEYVARGLAELIHEPSDTYEQSVWVTRMARSAAAGHGADWVIHADADEFWISLAPDQTLRQAIAMIPPACRLQRVRRWNAVIPRELEATSPAIALEGLDWFDADPRNSLGDPLPSKVMHRADPDVVVAQGNHDAQLREPGESDPQERLLILHFPYRGQAHYANKIRLGGRAYLSHPGPPGLGLTWRVDYRHYLAGRLSAICHRRLPDAAQCAARQQEGRYRRPPNGLALPRPSTAPATPIAPEARKAETQSTDPLGIITLADDAYFCGTRLLALSCGGHLPIIVYDLGLGEAARAWIEAHPGIERRAIPDTTLVRAIQAACGDRRMAKASKREWPLWICPTLIEDAPWPKVFWMDSDLVLLRDLEEMVQRLEEGPFVVEENLAPEATDNPASLYSLLPLLPGLHQGNRLRLNAGLTGWDRQRDAHLLEAYQFPIRQIFLRGALPRDAVRWHDQGALIWALQQAGHDDRLLRPRRWNLCVAHTALKDLRLDPQAEDSALQAWIEQLRSLEKEAAVVHWNGCPLPWSA